MIALYSSSMPRIHIRLTHQRSEKEDDDSNKKKKTKKRSETEDAEDSNKTKKKKRKLRRTMNPNTAILPEHRRSSIQEDRIAYHRQRHYEIHLNLARDFVRLELMAQQDSGCGGEGAATTLWTLLRPYCTEDEDPYLALAALERRVYAADQLPASLRNSQFFWLQAVARYTALWRWSWQLKDERQPLGEVGDDGEQQEQQHESLDLDVLPTKFREDAKFLESVLLRRPEAWYMLPEKFHDDVHFALLLPGFNDQLAEAVLEKFPALRRQPEFWLRLIGCELPRLWELLQAYAVTDDGGDDDDNRITSSPGIMLPAYLQDHRVRDVFADRLWTDRHVVELVLREEGAVALPDLPAAALQDWPDLVLKSFHHAETADRTVEEYTAVAEAVGDLFGHGRIRTGWFTAGLPFLPHLFPVEWTTNRQLFLVIAEYSEASFRYAAPPLKDDAAYMLQVIERSPALYFETSPRLRELSQLDLAVTALAHADRPFARALHDNDRGGGARLEHFFRVADRVQAQLDAWDRFCVLVGEMACQFSSLSLLSAERSGCGTEREKHHQKLIAEFLDVPMAGIVLLQEAKVNFGWVFDDENHDIGGGDGGDGNHRNDGNAAAPVNNNNSIAMEPVVAHSICASPVQPAAAAAALLRLQSSSSFDNHCYDTDDSFNIINNNDSFDCSGDDMDMEDDDGGGHDGFANDGGDDGFANDAADYFEDHYADSLGKI